MCLKELRDEFLYDCECRHLAKGSLRNYRASTRFLLEFLERKQITELENVRPRHLRDLMKEKQDAGNTPRYINDLLKVWRTWFNYLVEEGYLEERDNPAKKVKPLRQPRTIIDTFTAAEMKRMIQFYDGKPMNFTDKPFERMMRQRPGTDSGHPCKHCRHKWECGYLLHQCRKKFRSVLGDTAPPAAGAVRP